MQIPLDNEAVLADEVSLIQRPIVVARASFLIHLALGMLLIPSQLAIASCGDYLQHHYTTPIKVERTESNNSQLPSKCAYCGSRSDTPVPMPLRTSERMEKAPGNMPEQCSDCLILGVFFVDFHLLAKAQYFREVSTPPPKQF